MKDEKSDKKTKTTYSQFLKQLGRADQEQVTEVILAILETPFFPSGLESEKTYSRVHDDNDGDTSEQLLVQITPDSDVWLSANISPLKGLRFRETVMGGGMSPRTRAALLILALAIKTDEEKGRRLELPEEND